MVQTVKKLPAMQETWVRFLGWEDSLEKGMATHSSILAWRIPRTEEPGSLSPRVAKSQTQRSHCHFWAHYEACRTLVSQPGVELAPTVKSPSVDHQGFPPNPFHFTTLPTRG